MTTQTNYELVDNTELNRYEFHEQGSVAYIQYLKTGNEIFLIHTEVPVALEGKGIGGAIVKAVLEEIESKQWRLIPICPYVATYLKRHPEWRRLVIPGYNT